MNFKKINEELENILEDVKKIGVHPKGFTMVDKGLGSVDNFLQKYIDKYGNLTIPEFIDVLMKKEKNGENILEESLKEDYASDITRITNLVGNLWELKFKRRELYGTVVQYCSDTCKDAVKIDFWMIKPQSSEDDYILELEIIFPLEKWEDRYESLVNKNLFTAKEIAEILKNDLEQRLDLYCELKEPHGFHYEYSIRSEIHLDDFRENLDIYKNVLKKFKIVVEDVLTSEYKKAMNTLNNIRNAEQDKYNTEKQLRLKKLKAKASNITVKQALSKSSVAKKIQALKNPTPEQLAKILAAIEESFILTESMDDLDEPIEDEYKEIREVLRDFFDREINFPEFVTIKQLKDFDKEGKLDYWEDRNIIDCAKEEGFEVDGDKIITPDTLF